MYYYGFFLNNCVLPLSFADQLQWAVLMKNKKKFRKDWQINSQQSLRNKLLEKMKTIDKSVTFNVI